MIYLNRGGIKHLWKEIRNLFTRETAGFATADMIDEVEAKIGPLTWEEPRVIADEMSNYTIEVIPIGRIVPIKCVRSGPNYTGGYTIKLPSGGSYFVIAGEIGRNPAATRVSGTYATSGVYSGGTTLATHKYNNSDSGGYNYSANVTGFIIRIS